MERFWLHSRSSLRISPFHGLRKTPMKEDIATSKEEWPPKYVRPVQERKTTDIQRKGANTFQQRSPNTLLTQTHNDLREAAVIVLPRMNINMIPSSYNFVRCSKSQHHSFIAGHIFSSDVNDVTMQVLSTVSKIGPSH